MKIAYISTYVPRQCGIATFTNDLIKAVYYNDHQQVIDQHVFAVSDEKGAYDYPSEVVYEIEQGSRQHYIGAASIINSGAYDVCLLEHEYGIYGGNSGGYILSLLKRLRIPLLVNLHTVLENPSVDEKAVLEEIVQRADKLIVMTTYAVGILQRVYSVPLSKIVVIPHGVPSYPLGNREAKSALGLAGKRVLLTFGFLSRNKGIDVAIKALPEVVRRFPDVVYLVVGRTHPNVLKHEGEEYRHHLHALVDELGLRQHVVFDNSFIENERLATYLSACDIYITPYLNEAQITSGTLSFAMGAGACVISTPYWHAKEALAKGRGILFNFKDHEGLSRELVHLLEDDRRLQAVRTRVAGLKFDLSWNKLALQYMELFLESRQQYVFDQDKKSHNKKLELPPLDLQHVRRLTNQVGIIQHATYATPNYHHGYCLDDNARALLLALMVQEDHPDRDVMDLISTYVSYIHYAQRADGNFKNFMSFDNRFLEDVGSEDAFGRCIWALGYLVRSRTNASFHQIGKEMFERARPHLQKLRSIRAIAYCVLGVAHYLEQAPQHEGFIAELRGLVQFICHEFNANKGVDWEWFEKIVSYDNAIIPTALLRANVYLHMDDVEQIALASASFLDGILFRKQELSLIGNDGWYAAGSPLAEFGQQPIEVYSTMLMYEELYKIDRRPIYRERVERSYQWFLGGNDLQLNLFDKETGGCCDGLESYGVNRNQGAESTITFWLSTVHMYRALKNHPLAKSSASKSSTFTVA